MMLVEFQGTTDGCERTYAINPNVVVWIEPGGYPNRCYVTLLGQEGQIAILAPYAEVVAKINDALTPPTEDTAYTLAK